MQCNNNMTFSLVKAIVKDIVTQYGEYVVYNAVYFYGIYVTLFLYSYIKGMSGDLNYFYDIVICLN